MVCSHGRCAKGKRLMVGVPHGHLKTTTSIDAMALRCFIAPFVLEGPINRDAFETYVQQVLIPELHPGDIVIMHQYIQPKREKLRAVLCKTAKRTIESRWFAIGELLPAFKLPERKNDFTAAGYDAIR